MQSYSHEVLAVELCISCVSWGVLECATWRSKCHHAACDKIKVVTQLRCSGYGNAGLRLNCGLSISVSLPAVITLARRVARKF
jgi:hypothetical protein